MTRDELEARIWSITGRQMTGDAIDAIVAAADDYITEQRGQRHPWALRHTSSTDLHPVIGALADAMLGKRAAALERAA